MNKLFLKGVQLFSQSRTSWSMLVVLVVRSGMSWHNLCDKGRGVYSRMYQPTNQPTRHAVAPQVLPVAPIPAPASRSELTGTPSWMCNISIYAFCFGSTVYTVNMGHFTTMCSQLGGSFTRLPVLLIQSSTVTFELWFLIQV